MVDSGSLTDEEMKALMAVQESMVRAEAKFFRLWLRLNSGDKIDLKELHRLDEALKDMHVIGAAW